MLNLERFLRLHPASNATVFNFQFFLSFEFPSIVPHPLSLIGGRKISLGFINLAARAVNKRGKRMAMYGRKKDLIPPPPLALEDRNIRKMLYLVNIYYSKCC